MGRKSHFRQPVGGAFGTKERQGGGGGIHQERNHAGMVNARRVSPIESTYNPGSRITPKGTKPPEASTGDDQPGLDLKVRSDRAVRLENCSQHYFKAGFDELSSEQQDAVIDMLAWNPPDRFN